MDSLCFERLQIIKFQPLCKMKLLMKKIQPLFLLFFSIAAIAQTNTSQQLHKNNDGRWFLGYDFNPAVFRKPAQSFGPMARWWWPGNSVTQDELRREINLFADNGFAGVEVQPMNLVIPAMDQKEREKITTWDTPEYYENLRAVMEEARRRGLIVDVTNGSGWPPAGPNLGPEDGFLSLEFSDTTVTGGTQLSFTLPQLVGAKNKTTVPPQLTSVVIAKLLQATAGEDGTVHLDAASTKSLIAFAHKGILSYSFPEGTWRVIAFWSVPSGEQTNIAAAPSPMTVVNHFDSLKVLKLYNYLFGERTGLQPYFGHPMRAVFSDSYEFAVNRHYSLDFLSYFKKKHGYDITPYLPVNMQKGYNFVGYMRPNAQPDFSFSSQDWRLRYDYDITIGELLGEHFFKTSRKWAEKRNLLFRTQGYGLNMDMIAMAGLASIPETESMLGSETNIKVMTSGALLYNRPIVSAESVVFSNRAYMTTPQKIKMAVDKLFAAGVNQVIYHGVPYRYTSEKVGPEGWYPFSSPLLGIINFASNLGEGNIFWKDQKEINEYVNRVQYALRSGKPHADVLLYYPFLSVEGVPDNEEEILTQGYVEGAEPPLPKSNEHSDSAKAAWAKIVYPLINQLEAQGVTWAWVNDASIQEAQLDNNGRINIRGNQFQALILGNTSTIQLKTAEQIKVLAGKGMHLLATGVLPTMQPSFLHWKESDQKTALSIATAMKGKNSKFIHSEIDLNDWIKGLYLPVQFKNRYSFTRQAEREMSDGSRIQFIWNKSPQWQTLALTLDRKYKSSYWLDAATGKVTKNDASAISYQLPPYGSVLLFASLNDRIADSIVTATGALADITKEVFSINKWNIKVDSVRINDSSLFNWKDDSRLKFSSAVGSYTATFQWQPTVSSSQFFLDLGSVFFTAEVYINNAFAGKRIYAPYLHDITKFLQSGTNSIEVRVTPGQLNDFIGKAKNGDKRYSQFKGKEDQVMSAGLVGPVVIRPAKGD
ncbi:MAG: glycosyl hydrolase family 2 [Segetibacter sp.]|nr:glycosyl hydrolase family 2 [Segetibacter sp.]